MSKKAFAAEREAAEQQLMQLKQSFCYAAEEQESKAPQAPAANSVQIQHAWGKRSLVSS